MFAITNHPIAIEKLSSHRIKRRKSGLSPCPSSRMNYTPDCATSFRHPSGLKPSGNLYEDIYRGGTCIRRKSLGPFFTALSDEQLLLVLSMLDANGLSCLGSCSRALYVFCSHDELWRALVLEELNGKFSPKKTWKSSYICTKVEAQWKEATIQVTGLYSDVFFQSFYCAQTPIRTEWLCVESLDRIDVSSLPLSEFTKRYDRGNRPVILENAISHWPALKKWTSDSYLTQMCQQETLYAGGYAFTMENYLKYCRTLRDDQPLCIFDKDFAVKFPSLAHDYDVPQYFQQDFAALLTQEFRPDYRWLIIGPERSGSTFHIDPNATNAWNAVIKGAKKWILFPPKCIPPGVFPSDDKSVVSTPISLMEWFLTFYAEISKLPPHRRPLEGICRAGEVVYVPHGWWHLVLNIEESIAITQNFISVGNVKSVIRFLTEKPDQVSGCAHEIRPKLGGVLIKLLRQKEPALLEQIEAEMRTSEREKSKWGNLLKAETFNFSFQIEDVL
uniref:Histone arginine demethylase putative n=1 Tax=Albugo laibachii Nc14 TaxID=890382 RepID=F0WG13_9STRA|nr:histone arginine demethylase putative [Albugo laibachii Nc14]|eukprot:CCA20147.1 histone arginine demethylase putative [Albugo laibachii Nc14]